MKSSRVLSSLAVALIAAAAGSFVQGAQAAPAAQGALSSKLVVQQLSMHGSAAVLAPAGQAQPGQVLHYDVTYHNAGAQAIEKLQVTLPIPRGTAFDPQGALQDKPQQASLDGVHFAAYPILVSTRDNAGKLQSAPAKPEQYRALRWSIPALAAHGHQSIRMDVQVLGPTR
jgi:uncharacterized repeat protein (TIGR01451 family)